ncbi:MAG: hypothetical protein JNK63_09560 [Chthonomonas sp.]|nr:hypothetical protein [Chthonomonas sp.]
MDEMLIPLFSVLLIFGIPIVAIVTSHRQKMKEMELRARNSQPPLAVEHLQNELLALRERVNEQALDVEKLKDLVRLGALGAPRVIAGETEEQRLNS